MASRRVRSETETTLWTMTGILPPSFAETWPSRMAGPRGHLNGPNWTVGWTRAGSTKVCSTEQTQPSSRTTRHCKRHHRSCRHKRRTCFATCSKGWTRRKYGLRSHALLAPTAAAQDCISMCGIRIRWALLHRGTKWKCIAGSAQQSPTSHAHLKMRNTRATTGAAFRTRPAPERGLPRAPTPACRLTS